MRRTIVLLGGLGLALLGVSACGGDDDEGRQFGGNDATDASTLGDVGFAEVTPGDTPATGDTEDEAGPPAEVVTCEDGCPFLNTRECVDATSWRVCTASGPCLAWSPPEACATDEACVDGQCVHEGPDCAGLPTGCDTPGERRCSADGHAVEICSDAYECPKWDLEKACPTSTTCAAGACSGGGAGACAQLEACVDTSCADEIAGGSNVKLAKCTLDACRTEYEGCMGPFGSGACKDILKCVQSCQDAACQQGCMKGGSYDANVQFLDVGTCLEDNCPGALSDPMGNLQCIMGTCGTPLNTCCGGSMMGCL